MSKTLNLLRRVREQRLGKQVVAINKNPSLMSNNITLPDKKLAAQVSRIHTTWIIGLILSTLLLLNFGFTLKLFLLMQNYSSERSVSMQKLDRVEKLLTDNASQIGIFSANVKQISADFQTLSSKTQNINSKVKEIEEANNAQTAAIENLIKAKNTLFNRANALEIEIDKFKEQQQ